VTSSASKPIRVPSPARQLSFHAMLVTARTQWLSDGLHEALGIVNPKQVKKDINRLVPKAAQRVLAKAGIRDEEVFPTPTVLRAQPTLVGYYRLLLGQPQKQFYTSATGLGPFKRVEETGLLNDVQSARLDEFCVAMCEQLALLVTEMVPPIRPRDVHELPLLTIGSQFQGANNNRIGREATRAVFLAVKKVVEEHIDKDNDQSIVVRNAAGRHVHITLAADPDIRIEEAFDDELRHKVAIEIKGGTDRSNAHNRAGEAEKSHQKASGAGFRDYWTVIAKEGLDMDVLKTESPTTNSWFDVGHVLAHAGDDWIEFRSRIAEVVGIPLRG